MTMVLPLSRTIVLTDLGATGYTVGLAAYDGTAVVTPTPTPTPTPPPTFSRTPSITTDGSPQVGETVVFDFGAADAPIVGSRLLRTDNDTVVLADASIGSYTLAAAAQLRLEVTARNSANLSTTILSAVITVAAAPAQDLPAPTQSNPANFVSGTNPPRWRVDIPGPPESNFDKTKHTMTAEWDNPATADAAFSPAAARRQEGINVQDFADSENATVSNLTKQPEGQLFRSRTRFVRIADGVAGPWSNYFVDRMAAAQIAPTSFDPAKVGAGTDNYAIVLSNDNRTAKLSYPETNMAAWANIARGIGAKVAFTIASTGGTWALLISTVQARSGTKMQLNNGGYTEVNGGQVSPDFTMTNGDVVELELVANATTPANIDVLVRKNGAAARRFVTNIVGPVFYGALFSGADTTTITITDYTHWGTV